MVDRAAAVPAENAGRVGVVDEDRGIGRLGRLDDAGQRSDVAIHAEHAIGDDEDQAIRQARPLAALLDRIVEDGAEGFDIGVLVDLARRLREAHPVDDRGVIELVGHDQVLLAGDRRDDSGIGREPGLEGQGRCRALEGGEVAFELLVQTHRPGDRADRARARPEVAHGLKRCLAQARMMGQTEIVVGRQADQATVVDGYDRPLARRHDPQRPIEMALA